MLPHEKTHGGPKADRYALLEATQLNTSPLVFLAGSDPAATSAALLALTEREPDASGTTADGVSHRLWVVDGQAAEPVLELMRAQPITIADGHHRYETALNYRNEQRKARGGSEDPTAPYESTLAYFANAYAPGSLLLPIHRVIRSEPAPSEAEWAERLPSNLAEVNRGDLRPLGPARAVCGFGLTVRPLDDGGGTWLLRFDEILRDRRFQTNRERAQQRIE